MTRVLHKLSQETKKSIEAIIDLKIKSQKEEVKSDQSAKAKKMGLRKFNSQSLDLLSDRDILKNKKLYPVSHIPKICMDDGEKNWFIGK